MKFDVLCDNKGSFQIALVNDRFVRPEFGKSAVLIRCDRLDLEDNERGLRLANKICDFLNTLPAEEQKSLLADEMIPVGTFR